MAPWLSRFWVSLSVGTTCLTGTLMVHAAEISSPTAAEVAQQVDRLILTELEAAQTPLAGLANDEDFLRRVSFDIAGVPPTPQQVTLFGLNPDPRKRTEVIQQLLASDNYGKNWGSYWRDVVYLSATNMRARGASTVFEEWMVDQLNQNRPWDAIVTDILTATGNIGENGATGLVFAHGGEAEEVAAEASRIFLGIQMQCANCHDHPTDIWKREQFHELAAYFPRASVRPIQVDGMQRGFEVVSVNQTQRNPVEAFRENPERIVSMLDRNRDRKLSKSEAEGGPMGQFGRIFPRLIEIGDTNKDGMLSVEELRKIEPPMMPGRGNTEHYMADLKDPSSKGTLIQPKFFVDESQPGKGLSDLERRQAAAKAFTDPENPWFAKAIINRVWNEMLGQGFYMPVDDMGPTRSPAYPEAMDTLAAAFVAHHYNLKWLIETVASTQTYQRQVRPQSVSTDALPFASQTPTRLRSDQLYSALSTVLGFSESAQPARGGMMAGGIYGGGRSPRAQFNQIFTFDPSTPQEDITGNVQQALFLMNTPAFRNAVSATGNSRLSQILRKYSDDQDAISELYLLALAREPSDRELQVCQKYLGEVGSRGEAYEDLLWSLLNSSEFLSKR
ncbi:DUF1549 domain-containing protein [bacterium]|nr:DUF1549 domain-containing protein [bacterium]